MNTTRTYPRSMREAFPHDYKYHSANDSEFNRHRHEELIVMAVGIIGIIGIVVMLLCERGAV